ncbi:MAG: rRNA maturation RNase YbeY [Methylobacteriaceae bacterium]|nr:rRNA maturation RNase YbeY [Methylobacteriaceae bacterium]
MTAQAWQQAFPDCEEFVFEVVSRVFAEDPPFMPVGAKVEEVEIAVLLADDDTLRQLNGSWRGIDQPTNVLSFPAARGMQIAGYPLFLGDIALGFETVAREAGEQNKHLAQHAAHLIVHGTLHLLGCDHHTNTDAVIMEAHEIRILAALNIPNPYED